MPLGENGLPQPFDVDDVYLKLINEQNAAILAVLQDIAKDVNRIRKEIIEISENLDLEQ